jgi:putative RecB family exonuclease
MSVPRVCETHAWSHSVSPLQLHVSLGESVMTVSRHATAQARRPCREMQRLASVDKKALAALLKDTGKRLGTARVALLKAELESLAAKHHTHRFWAKEFA